MKDDIGLNDLLAFKNDVSIYLDATRVDLTWEGSAL
jgi:hypothetical protein